MNTSKLAQTNRPRILLIGCGGIGQYHLMALLRLERPVRIDLVEPRSDRRDRARAIIEEQGRSDTDIEITDDLPPSQTAPPDVTIITTQAAGRARLLDRLLRAGHRRVITEKMVCQSREEYESLLKAAAETGGRVWVNVPSRYNEFYRNNLPRISGPMVMHVVGSGMGLGSNAIHFFDLYARLRGNQSLRISGDHLFSSLLPNKRGSDLVEFSGTLFGGDLDEGVISISNLDFEQPTQTISIASDSVRIFIDELGEVAESSSRTDGWHRKTHPYAESRVSLVTKAVVENVLNTDDCLLPTIQDLAALHIQLFSVFNEHVHRVTGTTPVLCPIT